MFSFNRRVKKFLSQFVPNIYIQSRLLHCVCLFTDRISIFSRKVRISKSSKTQPCWHFFFQIYSSNFLLLMICFFNNINVSLVSKLWLQKGAKSMWKSQRELVTLLFAFESFPHLGTFWIPFGKTYFTN